MTQSTLGPPPDRVAPAPKPEPKVKAEVKAVYVASERGFADYCSGCPQLLGKETIKSPLFAWRVKCSATKCVKPTIQTGREVAEK